MRNHASLRNQIFGTNAHSPVTFHYQAGDLENALRPHRGKMTAAQLLMLEKNFMDRGLFERARLPRLSLFYLV